jgi:hypothetical protein
MSLGLIIPVLVSGVVCCTGTDWRGCFIYGDVSLKPDFSTPLLVGSSCVQKPVKVGLRGSAIMAMTTGNSNNVKPLFIAIFVTTGSPFLD